MASQQVGLFDGIDDSERDEILTEYFAADTNVRGQISVRGFTWIAQGEVRVCVRIQRERSKDQLTEVVLDRLGEGTFFGEIVALAPKAGPSAYTLAAKQCTLRYLRGPRQDHREMTSTDVLRNLIGEHPQVAINVIAEMGRKLRRTNRLIPVHPDGRVALYLREATYQREALSSEESRVDSIQESVAISETAVRNALSNLEAAGAIRKDNHGVITIKDRSVLESHLVL